MMASCPLWNNVDKNISVKSARRFDGNVLNPLNSPSAS